MTASELNELLVAVSPIIALGLVSFVFYLGWIALKAGEDNNNNEE